MILLNKLVQLVMLLTCILKVPGLKLGWDVGSPD